MADNQQSILVTVASMPTIIVSSGIIGPEGKPGIVEDEIMYAKRTDIVSDSLLYKGEAAVGSSDSSQVWRIRKVLIGVDGDVSETWALGTANFTNAWSDRLTLIYS
jgi:hypothetical protein